MPELEERLTRLTRSTPEGSWPPRPAQPMLRRAMRRRRRKLALLAILSTVPLVVAVASQTALRPHTRTRLATTPAGKARGDSDSTSISTPASTTSTPSSTGLSASSTTARRSTMPRPPVASVSSTTVESELYGVKPDAMLPGPAATDPCLGRTTVPIAVAGNRSPDGRAWAVLQHGSVGTSDDVAQTWSWHCKVLTVGSDLLRPRGIVAWGHDEALVWGVTPNGEPDSLVTGDGGATWATTPASGVLGATTADVHEVLVWTISGSHLARLSSGTWSSVPAHGLEGTPAEVALIDRLHGWAYGQTTGGTVQSWLASTDDGGDSWTPLNTPPGRIDGIAPSTDAGGCVLIANTVACTSDHGSAWTSYRVDVSAYHVIGLPPSPTGTSTWDSFTTVTAGDGGGVRFFVNGTFSGGSTIDYTTGNPNRFLASAWGRYVTTNSWDGCMVLMDRAKLGNRASALGSPAPDDTDGNPC